MPDPHPKSPEWRVIEHALVRGFLSPEQLDTARAAVGKHPGQEDAALLREVVRNYTSPENVDVLRAYYEEQKEVFKREAAEAKVEVLSISDILVRPVLEIDPDSGRFRQIPMDVAIAESGSGSGPIESVPETPKWSVDDTPKAPPPVAAAPPPAWDEDPEPESAPLALPENFRPPQPAPQPDVVVIPEAEPAEQSSPKSGRSKRPSIRSSGGSGSSEGLSPVILISAVVGGVAALASAIYLLL